MLSECLERARELADRAAELRVRALLGEDEGTLVCMQHQVTRLLIICSTKSLGYQSIAYVCRSKSFGRLERARELADRAAELRVRALLGEDEGT
jgi:HEPN domain-containing protein